MKRIYVLTKGAYYEFSIEGVYTSHKKAVKRMLKYVDRLKKYCSPSALFHIRVFNLDGERIPLDRQYVEVCARTGKQLDFWWEGSNCEEITEYYVESGRVSSRKPNSVVVPFAGDDMEKGREIARHQAQKYMEVNDETKND